MIKQIKILLVDDRTMFRESLKQVINSKPNYKVIAEATNGIEGIEAAKKYNPDVILMDINMPKKMVLKLQRKLNNLIIILRLLFLLC